MAGKLLPLSPGQRYSALTRPPALPVAEDGLPLPPEDLWRRWGTTAERYLAGGRLDAERMLAILGEAGVPAERLARILDFGCAEGRMLRFLPRRDGIELWGVDINAERIAWAQQHLAPPLRFATTTTAPHLPFEDNYFDLVYCVSVFTHISELADAWFLELLRVLRPEGHVFLTVHDEHTVELLAGEYSDDPTQAEMVDLVRRFGEETGILAREWVYFTVLADPAAQVFYRTDDLVEKWAQLADCVAVKREATGYQTALVFRKRRLRSPVA